MALGNIFLIIGFVGKCIFFQTAGISPQAHGSPLVGGFIPSLGAAGSFIIPLQHQVDDRIRCEFIKLGTVGLGQAGHIARKFNDCNLHTQTYAEIGYFIYPGIVGRTYLTFDTPGTKTAGYQHAVSVCQHFTASPIFYFF